MERTKVAALFDGKIKERLIGRFLDPRALMDIIVSAVRQNAAQLTADSFEAVASYLEELYETHIRPFDIPYVPNGKVEDMVDDLLKAGIRPALKQVFERFVTATS